MLTLGLPTSATAAIMLSAFQSYGITPGPLLLQQQSALVWGLIASLYIANVMLLVLNLPLVGPVGEDAQDSASRCSTAASSCSRPSAPTASASRRSTSSCSTRWASSGLFMRIYDFPTAPVIIGVILGPLAEQEFRRAMTISQGDMMIFLQKPLSLALLLLALAAVLGPQLWRLRPSAVAVDRK